MEAEVVKRLNNRARNLQQSGARTKNKARRRNGDKKGKGRHKGKKKKDEREEGEGVQAVESISGEEVGGGQATTIVAEETKV